MDRKEIIEVYFGGAFGIIAVFSAILGYVNPSISALAGCVKDVAGTMVVIVLLFASIKIKPFNLVGKLRKAVEDWGKDNAPLIFKAIDFDPGESKKYFQGFKLLQEPNEYVSLINQNLQNGDLEWEKYAKYRASLTGKFISFPTYEYMTKNDFDVLITMKQSHFTKKDDFGNIVGKMKEAYNSRFLGMSSASRAGEALELTLKFSKIKTNENIENFVDALDFILSLVKVAI